MCPCKSNFRVTAPYLWSLWLLCFISICLKKSIYRWWRLKYEKTSFFCLIEVGVHDIGDSQRFKSALSNMVWSLANQMNNIQMADITLITEDVIGNRDAKSFFKCFNHRDVILKNIISCLIEIGMHELGDCQRFKSALINIEWAVAKQNEQFPDNVYYHDYCDSHS